MRIITYNKVFVCSWALALTMLSIRTKVQLRANYNCSTVNVAPPEGEHDIIPLLGGGGARGGFPVPSFLDMSNSACIRRLYCVLYSKWDYLCSCEVESFVDIE